MTRKFEQQLDHIARAEKYLLKPGSYWMQQWDHVMVLCLIFTALITPYEVAFSNGMSSFSKIDALFVSNRLVDFLFLCDMVISFNLMYHDKGHVLVKSRKRIWRRYLCGWFSIDLITVLPYDAVGYLHLQTGVAAQRIRSLRALRLFKLFRILRASRVFLASQTRFGISTSVTTIMNLMLALALLNHWLACMWGMVASLQPKDRVTWLSVWLDGQELTSHECSTAGSPYANAAYRNIGRDHGKYFFNSGGDMCWYHSDVYAACLHWSTMTVTSIGYGDIVPTNKAEYIVSVACMSIAGVSWAKIIGEICGIANSRDPLEAEHGQTMDDVNALMCSLKLPQHLRQDVRRFVLHSKSAMKAKARRAVISKLSPLLRSHMTNEGMNATVRGIFWTRGLSNEFTAMVLTKMQSMAFPPRECIQRQDLCVLQAGTVIISGADHMNVLLGSLSKPRTDGKPSTRPSWNEDMLLKEHLLRRTDTAYTISYSLIDFFPLERLLEVLREFPDDAIQFRKNHLWLTMLRGLQFMGTHDGLLPFEWQELQQDVVQEEYGRMLDQESWRSQAVPPTPAGSSASLDSGMKQGETNPQGQVRLVPLPKSAKQTVIAPNVPTTAHLAIFPGGISGQMWRIKVVLSQRSEIQECLWWTGRRRRVEGGQLRRLLKCVHNTAKHQCHLRT
jgi:hypothetical protein